ncbi:hypothetical protein SAY86_029162 [Trapa natans]|uniref:Uncharacterized protein n=1 Tax=Trapa natans TaxID=22666 RepID=A0AAN7MKL2_TRANT|nr:hypothetical protein SAY86_029162 [Trapa natans]
MIRWRKEDSIRGVWIWFDALSSKLQKRPRTHDQSYLFVDIMTTIKKGFSSQTSAHQDGIKLHLLHHYPYSLASQGTCTPELMEAENSVLQRDRQVYKYNPFHNRSPSSALWVHS